MTFDIRAETATGGALGSGPIVTATRLRVTTRLDRAGRIDLDMPSTDPNAALFPDDEARYVRARAMRSGTRITAGRGVIRHRSVDSERMTVRLSGPDLLDELTRTHVGTLRLAVGTGPKPAADILPAIMAYALPGWTTSGTPSGSVYYEFGDETVLAALVKVAEILGDHFRLSISVDRRIEWLPTTAAGFDAAASGLRAVDVGDPERLAGNPDVCLIVGGLEESVDDTQRITRIYPRGAGNAGARLYLNGTTRTAPAGYTLHLDADPAQSYIKYNASDAVGIISATETFRDIASLDGSSAGNVSGSNTLFDAALVQLKRRITAQKAYRLRVTKVHRDLRVGETIHVRCKHLVDGYTWIDVSRPLMLLEIAPTYEAAGEPVYELQVTA